MREVRLHDTLSGELRPIEPRDPPRVGIYACGPTVYARIHIGNARPYVVFSLLRRFLEHEGYEPALVVNVTDVNDKIYDAAREQGVGERGACARDDGGLRGGHRPPRHRPSRRRAEGQRDDRADRGADRGPRGIRARVRGGRRRLLQRRELPGLRPSLQPPARRDAAGGGRRRRGAQARAAGLRALEGHQGGRGHELGLTLGAGAPGLAHRVLRDGRADPRRGLRGPRRRLGPRVPPPRERGCPDRGRARASRWPGCGCTTAWSSSAPRRWPSPWATSGCCTARSTSTGRRRC